MARTQETEAHVESASLGYLLYQDAYCVGTIKGAGRINLQSVVDTFCSLAFGRHSFSTLPMTAVDLVNDRMLPFYEAHEVTGREFCGRPQHHPYELFVGIYSINHRNTKVHDRYTNGFCQRFHQTVSDKSSRSRSGRRST